MIETLEAECLKCQRCELAKTRRNVVFGRGCVNPLVIFLGEAPGKAEDSLGQPWVGPSGRFLESALGKACLKDAFDLQRDRGYYLNIVACRPCDSFTGPNRPPKLEEVIFCRPRLIEQIKKLAPEVVVRLGRTAQIYSDWLSSEEFKWIRKIINLPHPAALLRRGGESAVDYISYIESLRDIWR